MFHRAVFPTCGDHVAVFGGRAPRLLAAAGLPHDRPLWFALLSAIVFCAAATVFAAVWRNRFRTGLPEWMRRLTDRRPGSRRGSGGDNLVPLTIGPRPWNISSELL